MSTPNSSARKSAGKRLEAPDILKRKGAEPLVSLTAYTAPMARLVDQVADIIIIGDSMGMVLYGLETTLAMPLFTMIGHARAVVDASSHALCVFDMPFGSYEEGPEQAFRNAARVMKKTGVQAVKLEGGEQMAETAAHLVKHGIPVMGHIGLTPQAYHAMGGFKVQGKGKGRGQVLRDARALDRAGVFSTVIEGVPEPLAREITKAVGNVTIGIGASAACDGQVLVTEDLLGLSPRTPKFVKQYADLNQAIETALKCYAEDVKSRRFPGLEHTYSDK
ncbi:MAG: 3-methyl-2-oxobutanoate hydroxymethyltransferase [Proteobacteria bacterium]|nr:3-methyl-2-oxobutanoate hydroxymethyltransferase [Pseudomonadota bacterium]